MDASAGWQHHRAATGHRLKPGSAECLVVGQVDEDIRSLHQGGNAIAWKHAVVPEGEAIEQPWCLALDKRNKVSVIAAEHFDPYLITYGRR